MTGSQMSPTPHRPLAGRAPGLSLTTVSDALRGKGRMDPPTAQRVRGAARVAGDRIIDPR